MSKSEWHLARKERDEARRERDEARVALAKMEAAMTLAISERNAMLDQARARSRSVAKAEWEAAMTALRDFKNNEPCDCGPEWPRCVLCLALDHVDTEMHARRDKW